MINDARRDMNLLWKHVDDSTIAVDADTANPDLTQLQISINNLQQWTFANDVTINATKPVVMNINL